ncbi:quinohemoprotein amine dehydrogenase subunit beta [Pseudomonas sp. R5(2019)]|uniref:quinohemoprotein amine dehydrogenase subunit beta n=1 Tax=Pseudomonas sp. R5(2019) TaxID=2697566 RepID=UPI001412DFB0|nr:quinohemoprotein amine dehydrogenase subunit beta [Pseudomonas sp. R5(2019)]NBA94794.1 quinohemoprotein amine dehydrogenase subunit beta [Pseudomonas sp. R5(2019)]
MNKKTLRPARSILLGAALLAGLGGYSQLSLAKDILVTAARPNLIVVADAEQRKVIHTFQIPNTSMGNSPGALAVSKDGKTVYVIHNRWESVSGIDLDSGKEVFRTDLSGAGVRGKAPYAIDISPDGKELAVYVTQTELLPGEYKVDDPFIAIYDTASGLSATPVRKLKSPRRVSTLAYSPDYKRLYAFSWDMLVLDPKTGQQIGQHPWRTWAREGFGEPDTLAIWPQFEQANEFATPYYINHQNTDKSVTQRAGIWSLDMVKDTVRFSEFEDAKIVLFSTVINPVRRNEAYTVYTQLTKTDVNTGKLIKRVDLDHTYYNVNVSTDGKELYIGGTVDDIAVYDSQTLALKGKIKIPGGGDQVLTSLRVVQR